MTTFIDLYVSLTLTGSTCWLASDNKTIWKQPALMQNTAKIQPQNYQDGLSWSEKDKGNWGQLHHISTNKDLSPFLCYSFSCYHSPSPALLSTTFFGLSLNASLHLGPCEQPSDHLPQCCSLKKCQILLLTVP